MLWNNQPDHDAIYRAAIAAYRRDGSLQSVEYHVSDANLGGFARFFLARHARRTGSSSPVFIMLDDDEDVTPSFADDMLASAGPRIYAGLWAWRYLGSHWDRVPAAVGEEADYVGTGGSVCDMQLVDDDRFFTTLPLRFAFLEDQWLSSWARRHGWSLRKVETPVEFVLHESNQFPALADLKDEFRIYLDRLPAVSTRRGKRLGP
ncbi:hypothetical protein ABIQ69_11845 [Agromyces sp. G08B096]|uniref:Glycosyltransferase n=1 Tax=Agromyces sp. G08B096 TaxID=3156399 RepID=A0AAU7W5V1_9MICO